MTPRVGLWMAIEPALALCACGAPHDDVVAVGASTADAGEASCGAVSRVAIAGDGGTVCTAALANHAFGAALCSCGDLTPGGLLTTVALSAPPTATSPTNAAVATNGTVVGAQLVDVGGDLTIAATSPLTVSGALRVHGDARLAGPATVTGLLEVGGDLWLGATASVAGIASVGGNLHLAPGAMLAALAPQIGGTTATDEVGFAEPCACGASDLVDIGGAIAAARVANDDARASLKPDDWAPPGATRATLSCGRYYLTSIAPTAAFAVQTTGHVALFVDGDVAATSAFQLTPAAGSEVDFFVGGSLTVEPGARLGDPARPAATRIYVLGASAITLPGTADFAADLYAPNAPVSVSALGDAYGSIFAASVSGVTGVTVHYDAPATPSCAPQGDASMTCSSCGG